MGILNKIVSGNKFHSIEPTGGELFFGRGIYSCKLFEVTERESSQNITFIVLRFQVESFTPNSATLEGDEASVGEIRTIQINCTQKGWDSRLKDYLSPIVSSYGNMKSNGEGKAWWDKLYTAEGVAEIFDKIQKGFFNGTFVRVVGTPAMKDGDPVVTKKGEPIAHVRVYALSHEEYLQLQKTKAPVVVEEEEEEEEEAPPVEMPKAPAPTKPKATVTPTGGTPPRKAPAHLKK